MNPATVDDDTQGIGRATELHRAFQRLTQVEKEAFMALIVRPSKPAAMTWHGYDEAFARQDDEFISITEAAEYLAVSITTLRRHIKAGNLVTDKRVGRNRMFRIGQVKTFDAARKQTKI